MPPRIGKFDFETYCEAGFIWNESTGKWDRPPGTPSTKPKGLAIVGAANYARHPTFEVLSLAYDLGQGSRLWRPGMPAPADLFAHIAAGGVLEAWNVAFEMWVWGEYCIPRLGWPPLPWPQVRCAMAKARANAWPGALDNAGVVARIEHQKDPDGKRLLNKFSIPRKPTKNDPRKRIRPEDDPADAAKLYAYNERDIVAEGEVSALCPDLIPSELEFWQHDQIINRRGVAIDEKGLADCLCIVEQAFIKYNNELEKLTAGVVTKASELDKLKAWAATRGAYFDSLDAEHLEEHLKRKDLPAEVYRALQIRALIGSASIKKLYAMRNQVSRGRLYDLFIYHAARTGRAAGAEVQPHNLPKDGPQLHRCANGICGRWFGSHRFSCPWCNTVQPPLQKQHEWNAAAFEDAFTVLNFQSLEIAEMFFGDAILLITGCVRALFVASPGHDLIASDYSAIEGVVGAVIAGEQWRIETFEKGEDIYLKSASNTTGKSYEFYLEYKKSTGKHHPDRQPYGKIDELSSFYGGGIGAQKAFGADEYFTDDQIRDKVRKWRRASPRVVQLWGGQERPDQFGTWQKELFGLEGAAIRAVQIPWTPGHVQASHPLSPAITFLYDGNALYCILPSGRRLTYHQPRLTVGTKFSVDNLTLCFWGWNTNPKMGAVGWVLMDTYGGKLTENVVQAVARDILAYAIVKAQKAGYPVVLHIHDEIVAELPHGVGSVAQLESIMSDLPPWAKGWPLVAKGGWRGRRYRKD